MNNINEYLKKNLIKDHGYCKQYKTIKASVVSSLDGTVTYYHNGNKLSLGTYYRFGLPAKEYYAKYKGSKDFKELGFLPPH